MVPTICSYQYGHEPTLYSVREKCNLPRAREKAGQRDRASEKASEFEKKCKTNPPHR